jgi:virulence factor Mce-like protein
VSSSRRIAVGALVAAVAVLAVVLLTGGSDGYTVRVEFKDAGGLRKNSSVKVAGVPAGKVLKLDVTAKDTAIATLKIDKNALPIGTGATVRVRPTDLLGERYAELDPGNRTKPIPSGSLIPDKFTSTPVELDDILNTLDADTRTRLGILINEAGVGLDGRGADFNKLLATLPPSLDQTRKLIDQVSSQNVVLKDLIGKGDRITATVNAKHDDLGGLIDQADGALTTVAQKRRELGATIQNAPGALAQLRTTLTHLNTASVALRPAASDLQNAAAPLNSTLKALPEFAKQAAPTLRTAQDVAPQLNRLGVRATPTIKRLQPTAKTLQDTLAPAAPALDHMSKRGTDDLLYFISNMNRALQGRDGVSHYIGAKIYIDSEMVTNAINAFNGYHPPAAANTKSNKPGLKLPKPDLAPLQKTVKDVTGKLPAVKKVTDAVKQVTDKVQPIVGDVTKKLGDAVDNVLGGLAGKKLAAQQDNSSGGDAIRLFNYLMGP